MLYELTTLSLFFEDPSQVYSAREIAKSAKVSHITIAKKLKEYKFIKRAKNGPYLGFKVELTPDFLHFRFFYNYQKLFKSGLVDYINKHFDYPCIVLFGSYAKAENTPKSDIDVCVISNIVTLPDVSEFEKKLNHSIQLFLKTKYELENMKKNNPYMLNSICNGIILQGELEVFK